MAGGEAVAGFFGAVGDEVRRRRARRFGIVGADAAFGGVEITDTRGIVFGEDDDIGTRLADERFEQALADLRRTEADEDDKQQGAPFATTVRVIKKDKKDGDAGEGDGIAAGLGNEIEQIVERGFVALPVAARKPEGEGNEKEQGGDGEEAGFQGW